MALVAYTSLVKSIFVPVPKIILGLELSFYTICSIQRKVPICVM